MIRRHATLFIIFETGSWNTQVRWVHNWICLGLPCTCFFLGGEVGETWTLRGSELQPDDDQVQWYTHCCQSNTWCFPQHLKLWLKFIRLLLCAPLQVNCWKETGEKDGPFTMFKFGQQACCHVDDRWNTLFYTAPMPFGSSFAANVDPGEFESTMLTLRGKKENHYFHSSDVALYKTKSTSPQLMDGSLPDMAALKI